MIDPIKEFPWLKGVTAGPAWSWLLFYNFVRHHGKPKGVIKAYDEDHWSKVLGVTKVSFRSMSILALKAKAMRFRVKSKTFIIPAIASPKNLGKSTMRMRKHRSKKQGVDQDSKPDQPVFTRQDAVAIRSAMILRAKGRKMPSMMITVILNAFTMLWDAGVENPLDLIRKEVHTYSNVQNPIDWLNNVVGREVCRTVELTDPLSR